MRTKLRCLLKMSIFSMCGGSRLYNGTRTRKQPPPTPIHSLVSNSGIFLGCKEENMESERTDILLSCFTLNRSRLNCLTHCYFYSATCTGWLDLGCHIPLSVLQAPNQPCGRRRIDGFPPKIGCHLKHQLWRLRFSLSTLCTNYPWISEDIFDVRIHLFFDLPRFWWTLSTFSPH